MTSSSSATACAAHSFRRPAIVQVRYESPCDLLPWADPYIASLFALAEREEEANACSCGEFTSAV